MEMKKNASEIIKEKLELLGPGSTISYKDFKGVSFITLAKALSRLVESGKLIRVRKGIYYYPKETVLGKTVPKSEDILSKLNWNDSLYPFAAGATFGSYALGLTTQVPAEKVLIGDYTTNRSVSLMGTTYRTRRRPIRHLKNLTPKEFYTLETIRILKNIPGTAISEVLKGIIKLLKEANHHSLIKAALYEPPRVRAILGAILEEIKTTENLSTLRKSLNPLTTFKLGLKDHLTFADVWRIK